MNTTDILLSLPIMNGDTLLQDTKKCEKETGFQFLVDEDAMKNEV